MRRNLDHEEIADIEVTLRIPGTWNRPEEFYERLPRECRCNEQGLVLADGTEFELHVLPADDEFPEIFAGSCPKMPTESAREQIDDFKVNICLTGPGGSITAAKKIMEGAAAVLRAGGAGVFVDNSGIAHGATDWLKLHESADDGGVYWAFVTAARSETEVYSIGMHILGFRDAIIPATGNQEYDSRTLHSFLGFTAFSGATLQDGEVVSDLVLPTFRVHEQADDRFLPDWPMFNPRGRWRLERMSSERNQPYWRALPALRLPSGCHLRVGKFACIWPKMGRLSACGAGNLHSA